MKHNKRAMLVDGAIIPLLIKLTIPMLFGIMAMVMFNLVDTYFVGRLGTIELAAISFTFPVVLVLNSVALGLGVGASAVISRAIGEGNQQKVQRLTTDSLTLAVLVVAIVVIAGMMTIEPLFKLLGASAETLPYIKSYMSIWYTGVLFVVIPMVGNNAIRATGDTKTPSIIMLVAVGVNIILDPIFIFGWGFVPAMGLAGAAIATVTARATTFFVALYILYFRDKMLTLKIPTPADLLVSWQKILYIGLPAAATNIVVPVSAGIITGMVASFGDAAVAGLGVSTRVEMFAMTVIGALGSVLAPFVGQNLGAGKIDRVKMGVKYSQIFAMGWGAVMFIILAISAKGIGGIFNDSPAVIQVVSLYLWTVPISYGLLGVLTLSTAAMNVLNKPLHAAALSVIRLFVLYIPLAILGSKLFDIVGIFGAATVANALAGITGFFWLKRLLQSDAFSIKTPASKNT